MYGFYLLLRNIILYNTLTSVLFSKRIGLTDSAISLKNVRIFRHDSLNFNSTAFSKCTKCHRSIHRHSPLLFFAYQNDPRMAASQRHLVGHIIWIRFNRGSGCCCMGEADIDTDSPCCNTEIAEYLDRLSNNRGYWIGKHYWTNMDLLKHSSQIPKNFQTRWVAYSLGMDMVSWKLMHCFLV